MAIEISVTKDMADKINRPLAKTQNIEPDIKHWYAKIHVFNRKRYVLATNTMTRFAVLFRLNSKNIAEDFKSVAKEEFERWGLIPSPIISEDIVLSLGNNKALTAQLNQVGQEIAYIYECHKDEYPKDAPLLIFEKYNKSNLGKAGDNKEITFAIDEMKKYFGEVASTK